MLASTCLGSKACMHASAGVRQPICMTWRRAPAVAVVDHAALHRSTLLLSSSCMLCARRLGGRACVPHTGPGRPRRCQAAAPAACSGNSDTPFGPHASPRALLTWALGGAALLIAVGVAAFVPSAARAAGCAVLVWPVSKHTAPPRSRSYQQRDGTLSVLSDQVVEARCTCLRQTLAYTGQHVS
jgi:hypothetical protein